MYGVRRGTHTFAILTLRGKDMERDRERDLDMDRDGDRQRASES
jgi:hypothetical protein